MTQREITFHIWPRDIAFHELLSWPVSFARVRGLTEPGFTLHQLTVDRYESINCTETTQICEILKRGRAFDHLRSTSTFSADGRSLQVVIVVSGNYIKVSFECNDIDLISAAHQAIKDEFGLRNPSIPDADSSRFRKVQATIFLGRHFDDWTQTIAAKLQLFLSLVGFEVVEGEEFTAQPIPEKVKRRIDSQDIYLGLVTGKREHEWITSEAGYALGKGKHVVLLVKTARILGRRLLAATLSTFRFPRERLNNHSSSCYKSFDPWEFAECSER